MKKLIKYLSLMDRAFVQIIKALLVIIILVMVVMGALQVVLRDAFNAGFTWVDVASRNMVLWLAFLGAFLATRKRQHIAIDVITRFIPQAPRNIVHIFLDMFSCFVTYLLAHAAYLFVMQAKLSGEIAFGQVPAWMIQAIIPFGCIIISVEYFLSVLLDIWRIKHPESQVARSPEGGRGI